jgi:hypothetical protein
MCVDGFKGADYRKIIDWYRYLLTNIDQLVDLLQNETELKILTTLDVIEGGLLSLNDEVRLLCRRLINKITEILYQDRDQALDEFKQLEVELDSKQEFGQYFTPQFLDDSNSNSNNKKKVISVLNDVLRP